MRFFPFTTARDGQRQFIADTLTAVSQKRHLLADAPAGIGKTAAVLSAALEYVKSEEGEGKKIFFVTPRHSQHKMAVDTVRMIRERSGEDISCVDIIGKRWLCNQENIDLLNSADFSDYCKKMREDQKCSYYNLTKMAGKFTPQAHARLYEIMQKGPLHSEELKETCGNFCAFELACRLAERADVVVSDYYHIFSSARDSLLTKADINIENVILIVDEAHNLPGRILKLLSRHISTASLGYAIKEASNFAPALEDDIRNINDVVRSIYNRSGAERYVEKNELTEAITDYDQLTTDLQTIGDDIREEKKKSFIGSLGLFLSSWQKDFQGFTRIVSEESGRKGGVISLGYDCLDPSLISKDVMDSVHSCICMSGTLKPMEMYTDVLGFAKERTDAKEYESSFPLSNRLDLLIPDVTTKYENRTKDEYKKMGNYITRCLDACPGNVAIFFPSYGMRDELMRHAETNKTLFIESNLMNKKEKAEFYKNFVKERNAVLMGCQAGSFGEGVDFPGLQLSTVVVVGIALERPTLKVKALIDYYDKKFGKGWEYAYSYPAVQRAVQASGRCIRSETDRGVSIFMDKRFNWPNYKKIFPKSIQFKVTTSPEKEVKNFFAG